MENLTKKNYLLKIIQRVVFPLKNQPKERRKKILFFSFFVVAIHLPEVIYYNYNQRFINNA